MMDTTASQPDEGDEELVHGSELMKMVALILPPIMMKASPSSRNKNDSNGGDVDNDSNNNNEAAIITVMVPAMYVYPFSRVACELLDDEALPPVVVESSSTSKGVLRPTVDFMGEYYDDDCGGGGDNGNVLPIDVSSTQVVQLPPPLPTTTTSLPDQDVPPITTQSYNESRRVHTLISTLFTSSFKALRQYQIYTQHAHMRRLTTLPQPSATAHLDMTCMKKTEDFGYEEQEEASKLHGLLREAVLQTFFTATNNPTVTSTHIITTEEQQQQEAVNDIDNSYQDREDDEGTPTRMMILMLYVLSILEVLDCPLLSEALSDIIVERGAYWGDGGEKDDGDNNDSGDHRLLMAELLLL